MIFTECPYCDETQVLAWEVGDPSGYFPTRCPKCNKVMWVEATSIGGSTFSHEGFMKEIAKPGDEAAIEAAASRAEVNSTVDYDAKEGGSS